MKERIRGNCQLLNIGGGISVFLCVQWEQIAVSPREEQITYEE